MHRSASSPWAATTPVQMPAAAATTAPDPRTGRRDRRHGRDVDQQARPGAPSQTASPTPRTPTTRQLGGRRRAAVAQHPAEHRRVGDGEDAARRTAGDHADGHRPRGARPGRRPGRRGTQPRARSSSAAGGGAVHMARTVARLSRRPRTSAATASTAQASAAKPAVKPARTSTPDPDGAAPDATSRPSCAYQYDGMPWARARIPDGKTSTGTQRPPSAASTTPRMPMAPPAARSSSTRPTSRPSATKATDPAQSTADQRHPGADRQVHPVDEAADEGDHDQAGQGEQRPHDDVGGQQHGRPDRASPAAAAASRRPGRTTAGWSRPAPRRGRRRPSSRPCSCRRSPGRPPRSRPARRRSS